MAPAHAPPRPRPAAGPARRTNVERLGLLSWKRSPPSSTKSTPRSAAIISTWGRGGGAPLPLLALPLLALPLLALPLLTLPLLLCRCSFAAAPLPLLLCRCSFAAAPCLPPAARPAHVSLHAPTSSNDVNESSRRMSSFSHTPCSGGGQARQGWGRAGRAGGAAWRCMEPTGSQPVGLGAGVVCSPALSAVPGSRVAPRPCGPCGPAVAGRPSSCGPHGPTPGRDHSTHASAPPLIKQIPSLAHQVVVRADEDAHHVRVARPARAPRAVSPPRAADPAGRLPAPPPRTSPPPPSWQPPLPAGCRATRMPRPHRRSSVVEVGGSGEKAPSGRDGGIAPTRRRVLHGVWAMGGSIGKSRGR
jgi:hypothetical protein